MAEFIGHENVHLDAMKCEKFLHGETIIFSEGALIHDYNFT